MKRLILAVSVILGWASAAFAVQPGTLTTLREIHALSNPEASHLVPVAFEATVTYYRTYERSMFVQDGGIGIFIQPPKVLSLVPGDRVTIQGTTQPSFRPFVQASSITLLHHGTVPKPVPANHDRMLRGQADCLFVTVQAQVRAADLESSSVAPAVRYTTLKLLTDGGIIAATLDSNDPNPLKDLLDTSVEITGVASGMFDGKMQQTGVLLHVSSLADVKITKRPGASPWTLPVTPMDEILTTYHVKDLTQRVRVHGTITYYEPGLAAVLQSGAKSLWINTQTTDSLRIGDIADATGFPDADSGFLTLAGSEIQDKQTLAPIAPQAEGWRQLVSSKHLFDLVSIEGEVVNAIRGTSQDEYALVSDGYMFSAIYRHPKSAGALPLPPMKRVPVGSRIRVTGICVLDDANPYSRDVPFNILLRTPDDIRVVARPSWLNVRILVRVTSVLFLAVVAVGGWGWALRRKVHFQTAALSARIEAEGALERRLAQLEKQRSRILENINGTEPLAGILEQITDLVSFHLYGVPCWCEVTDGARLGNFPPEPRNFRVIVDDIPARSGPALGRFFAGFAPGSLPGGHEAEALSVGTRLATLAIETRRLYSDLRHRSEFDLLTDIHNRFSLDKHLDGLIEEARQTAYIFGLIYIDLDQFKQVNDLYGHQVGDQYLQEVASRMKGQLRSADMLARLGGDEFAALVTVVRSRAEVEEIAERLERSLDDPYPVEGYFLHGSASVGIALYPEDGGTKNSLLSAADAAMYVAKHIKRQTGDLSSEHQSF